jgi:hypothetical protein
MFGQPDDHTNSDQPVTTQTNTNFDDLKPADVVGGQMPPNLAPSVPSDQDLPAVAPETTVVTPQNNFSGMSAPITDTGLSHGVVNQNDVSAPTPDQPSSVSPNELLELKNHALHQLEPLVDHLDQTPEEKFKTTLMMIQASDNQALIKPAFETAQKITDEKERAQALLDLINEINYFTQLNKAA